MARLTEVERAEKNYEKCKEKYAKEMEQAEREKAPVKHRKKKTSKSSKSSKSPSVSLGGKKFASQKEKMAYVRSFKGKNKK